MTGPREVLDGWFAAHAAGDLNRARALMAADALLELPGGVRVEGFDAFMAWYADRSRREGPDFGYHLIDLLTGTAHVAAVLELTDGSATWQQVAVYRVDAGLITAVSAYEGDRP